MTALYTINTRRRNNNNNTKHKTLRDDDVNDDVIKGGASSSTRTTFNTTFFYRQMSSSPPNATTHDGHASSYDEVDLEDMEWDEALKAYTYACPCGDIFRITLEELHDGEEIARCPSCSLILTVVYDPDDLSPLVA